MMVKECDLMSLGPTLKEIRVQKQFSLDKMANELKMSPEFLTDIENGMRQPTMPQLARILDWLEVGLTYTLRDLS